MQTNTMMLITVNFLSQVQSSLCCRSVWTMHIGSGSSDNTPGWGHEHYNCMFILLAVFQFVLSYVLSYMVLLEEEGVLPIMHSVKCSSHDSL